MSSAIDAHLDAVRARYARIEPLDAAAAVRAGALLVDIRPAAQRAAEGEIPAALVVDRNVLEWRLDPTSPDRLDAMTGPDVRVVVFCSEGYASSLAAWSLRELGVDATDVVGGFRAWSAAGLPARPPFHPSALPAPPASARASASARTRPERSLL